MQVLQHHNSGAVSHEATNNVSERSEDRSLGLLRGQNGRDVVLFTPAKYDLGQQFHMGVALFVSEERPYGPAQGRIHCLFGFVRGRSNPRAQDMLVQAETARRTNTRRRGLRAREAIVLRRPRPRS